MVNINYIDIDDSKITRLRKKGLSVNDKNELRETISELGKLGKGPYSPLVTEAILTIISYQDEDVEEFGLNTIRLMLAGKI